VVPAEKSLALPSDQKPQAKALKIAKTWSYDVRTDLGSKTEQKPMSWKLWLEGLGLLTMASADNVLAYLTFFTVRAFHGRLYTVVDLQIILLPGIDVALIIFAAVGSLAFLMMIILVECMKKPLFHELMNFRLMFSAVPCGIICGILLYYSERTHWAPFATVVAVQCTVFMWCLHMRVTYAQSLNVVSKIALDISWFLGFVCVAILAGFFFTDSLKIITNSDDLNCPYAPNDAMPVLALPLSRWYCVQWTKDEAQQVSRAPINSVPVQVTCTATFVSAFGMSIEPHLIKCPTGCLRNLQGSSLVGCGVYSADSPLCVAAIHAGILNDQGGEITVYGRLGVSQYQRCTRNSLSSSARFVTQSGSTVSIVKPTSGDGSSTFFAGGRRLVTVPSVVANGVQIPQAFHFNTDLPAHLPQTREFIWLKQYDKAPNNDPSIEDGKPWTRIQATVSLRMAGIELSDEKVTLGQTPHKPLFVVPHPGQVFDQQPVQCSISEKGVVCTGAGAAVVQLDFCRKDVKQCPG
jgi:hypothetical protein